MVNVIVGQKGSGKTKELIEAIQSAVKNENGDIVCIEKGNALRFDVNYRCRLIDAGEYQLSGYTFLKGFICGLHAGNNDISKIFIDSFYKIIAKPDDEKTAEFLAWCDEFGKKNQLDFYISLSQDPATAPEGITKYA